jgi:cytochrome P450
MDLAKKIPYFTLDVISHIGLGQPFGDLVADKDQMDYLKASEEGLKIGNSAWAMGISWLPACPIIGPAISPSEKDASGFGRMMAEARKIVDGRRMKTTEAKSDMLASFVRHGVAGDDLFQEAFEQIVAGSDTTSAAIRITMLYIMTHPRVYRKLQTEIDQAAKSGVTSDSQGIISDLDARALPYLGAVVREAIRVSYQRNVSVDQTTSSPDLLRGRLVDPAFPGTHNDILTDSSYTHQLSTSFHVSHRMRATLSPLTAKSTTSPVAP